MQKEDCRFKYCSACRQSNKRFQRNDYAQRFRLIFWDCLTHETTIDEVVEKVISEYDIDTETAKRDIEKFIKMLEDNNLLEK